MDWAREAEAAWGALAPDGARWDIRRSDTCAGMFSLFRRPPGVPLPSEPEDERDACAVLRSPGEAKVMAALLDGRADPDTPLPRGFVPTYEHEGRRGWSMGMERGSLSIHRGSDEDLRDVVVERSRLMTLSPFAIISHGRDAHMPSGARPLQAASALLALALVENRLRRPLDDEDHRLWSLGRPVATQETESPGDIAAKARALSESGDEPEGLKEAALAILAGLEAEGDDPGRIASLRRRAMGNAGLQYSIVANLHGENEADAILERARSPGP